MAAPERFLVDGMLGSVARWLRLLGFDAAFVGSTLGDDEVLRWAEREDRFLATMDLALVQRCIKKGIPALLLRPGGREEQLLILLMHSGAPLDPKKFFTRCTECGNALESVPLSAVASVVPEAVRQKHTDFWKCPNCGHVYWHGSHVTEIEERILELVRRISASN